MAFFSWLLGSTQTAKTPYPEGFLQKHGIGSYSKVILKHNDWTLWEISYQGMIGFVAIKPAIHSKIYELPMTPLFINGGSGYFMNHMCHTHSKNAFYQGFYGEYRFRHAQIAQIEERIIKDISSLDIEQLQEKYLDFEVTTCLDKQPNRIKSNVIKNSGTIYLDDIKLVYKKMMEHVNSKLESIL